MKRNEHQPISRMPSGNQFAAGMSRMQGGFYHPHLGGKELPKMQGNNFFRHHALAARRQNVQSEGNGRVF